MKRLLIFLLFVPLIGLAQVQTGDSEATNTTNIATNTSDISVLEDTTTAHNTRINTVTNALGDTATIAYIDQENTFSKDQSVSTILAVTGKILHDSSLSYGSEAGNVWMEWALPETGTPRYRWDLQNIADVSLQSKNGLSQVKVIERDTSGSTTEANLINIKNITFSGSINSGSYGTMGFADSAFVIPCVQNVYSKITNTWKTLYTTGTNSGLTIQGDTIKVPTAGNYAIMWDLSFSGANTDSYHITIWVNNVQQRGKGEAHRDVSVTKIGTSCGSTILTLTADAWISLRIMNDANSNNVTVQAGNITVQKKL